MHVLMSQGGKAFDGWQIQIIRGLLEQWKFLYIFD